MSSNTAEIVQEIRREFESMLLYVHESRSATADQMERGLFRRLLALGGQLMVLFFCLRAAEYPRTPVRTPAGVTLPYHGEKKRSYYSIFGKLPVWRPYFYGRGVGGASPLDEALSLGADCYSDLVREIAEYLGVGVAYDRVSQFFAHVLDHALSTQALVQMVGDDASDVTTYYAQQPAAEATTEAAILVLQADGKGVPMVREQPVTPKARLHKGDKRTKKKEAVVTTAYTIAPTPRTAAQVVASFFAQEPAAHLTPPAHNHPQHKQLWATLTGKAAALDRLAHQVAKRDGPQIQHRVALTDGCEALQQRVAGHFPAFTLVLDFVHASEYLWKAANSLFGEQSPKRTPWVEQQALALLSGHADQVIAACQTLAQHPKRTKTQRLTLHAVAAYLQRNRPFMRYDHYLAQGWPIASGVIEGACRHLVKDRCELSGMRWTQSGAENLLQLRAVAENGDWEDYHTYRKQQRHLRLYGVPCATRCDPEDVALPTARQEKAISFDQFTNRRHRRYPSQPLAA